MLKLTLTQKKAYFERSYKAVDGLWFMKTEEAFGFDKALEIDVEVWKVMPKIQARQLKPLCKTKDNKKAFLECFTAKLKMEGFKLKKEPKAGKVGVEIEIVECPWVKLMEKSGRSHLAGKVGERICNIEYPAWAEEFNTGYRMTIRSRLCGGDKDCVLAFRS